MVIVRCLLLGFPLIFFGVAFILWSIFDSRIILRRRDQTRHVHHILLGIWSFLTLLLIILLQGNLADPLLWFAIFLTGLIYLFSGLRDLRREVVRSHQLEKFMAPNTLLTKTPYILPLWATLIVGVLGTLFGFNEVMMNIFTLPEDFQLQIIPFILILCGLMMLFIYAKLIAWQHQEMYKLIGEVLRKTNSNGAT